MLTLAVEIGLIVLLAATLGYCMVLERRLSAVRKGQEGLKTTIGDLNASIARASQTLHALQAAAATTGEALDVRVTAARATIDELSLLTASGERIASRMERSVETKPQPRTIVRPGNAQLPSGSVMGRLEALRAAR
jgi:Domain of unknown function (DUF6468)